MNKRIKFAATVGVVKNFLDAQGLDFMVVGSGALLIHGLELNRYPHDVDIEVCCEDEKVLKVLADSYGNTFYQTKENYPDVGEHKPYIFKITSNGSEILINAWAVKKFTHPYAITYEGVKYAPVGSVLRRKMLIGRTKDYKDLSVIAKNILNIDIQDKTTLLLELFHTDVFQENK